MSDFLRELQTGKGVGQRVLAVFRSSIFLFDRMHMTSRLQHLLASGYEIATVARLGPLGEGDSLSDLRVCEQLAANRKFDLLSA